MVAFFALSTFASIYTDRLWYHAVGYGSVFSRLLWTKVVLFLVFGSLMAAAVVVNVVVAFRLRPLFHPQSPEQSGLDRYRQAVTPIRTWLVAGLAVLLGIFAGTSGSGAWRTYMLWRHAVPFHRKDAYFHKDIGFFVFQLPWYHYVIDFAMAVTVVCLLAAAVVHYLYGGIRLQTPGDRLSGAAQAQLSVLLGVFVLAKSVDYWFDRYDLAYHSGSLLTGVTYTGEHAVLPAKVILMGISLICALLFFLNVWRRTWMLPSMGLALLVLSAVLLGLIWPGIVQQFQVKPSEADKEAPFIAKNIAATRAAYDIDTVQELKFGPGAAAPATNASQVPGADAVPLVDPQLVRQNFEQQQQVRSFYSVAPVLDVDHYQVNGVDRALVLGARELDQNGINPTDQNWLNEHTAYTHGNGIIAAFANQRDAKDGPPSAGGSEQDRTQWAEGSAAGQDYLTEATGCYEPRIYYGEDSPDYSVVGKASASAKSVELDLQRQDGPPNPQASCEGDQTGDTLSTGITTTYAGGGGVAVGSTFRQLLYAIKFGSTNFLLSGRVNDNSEVLYNRNPRDRVQKVAPWLTLDDDVYPVVVDHKILWVLDGYTTTDRFPGSERESYDKMTNDSLQDKSGLRTLPTDQINYMRNSVKATVDAYTGQVTLYAWDDSDPILKAWSAAFPGTVEPKADIPPDLLDHLRYPEDYFKVQRYQFARYHVTNPSDWFQGNNRWDVPEDPNVANKLQPPYRMFVTMPAGLVPDTDASDADSADAAAQAADIPDTPTWSLTSTFVPYKRNNLAAYVSVDSDASSPTYGQMRVIDVLQTVQLGPSQVNNTIRADPDVTSRISVFNRGGGTVSYGNLLTVPVGDQLMYVEPVYAQISSGSASYPILQFVLVYYQGEVGVGDTLPLALQDAIDSSSTGTTPPTGTPSGTPTGTPSTPPDNTGASVKQLLTQAQEHFVAADTALKQGDLKTYADEIDQARQLVNQALALENGGATPPSSGSPSGGGSSSGTASPSP